MVGIVFLKLMPIDAAAGGAAEGSPLNVGAMLLPLSHWWPATESLVELGDGLVTTEY